MRNAHIISSGSYVPERELPNAYFNELLGENVSDWLEENLQIYSRRWCQDDEAASDLSFKAAINCLDNAGLSPEALDLIIVATDTPDYISPSTATIVQDKLAAINAGTFDINSACAGFVTALDVASKYIRGDDQYNNVLVIGAYAMSKHLNREDKKTVTLFADGAACVLLQAIEDKSKGFQASELISMGQYNSWMGIYGGGSAYPLDAKIVAANDHKLKFVHKFPKELNPVTWSSMARKLNDRLGVSSDDVSQYFITQLNINSIHETMDALKQDHSKAHTIMHDYAYTGSACIPMAFHDAMSKGMLKSGDLLYFIGSGGGLAFASAAFRL